jgi:hypothetical protein
MPCIKEIPMMMMIIIIIIISVYDGHLLGFP